MPLYFPVHIASVVFPVLFEHINGLCLMSSEVDLYLWSDVCFALIWPPWLTEYKTSVGHKSGFCSWHIHRFITGLAGALLFLVFSCVSASSLKSDPLGAGKPSKFCHGFWWMFLDVKIAYVCCRLPFQTLWPGPAKTETMCTGTPEGGSRPGVWMNI